MKNRLVTGLMIILVIFLSSCLNKNDVTTPIHYPAYVPPISKRMHHETLQPFSLMKLSLQKMLQPQQSSQSIIIYSHPKLLERPYRIIGTTTISKYNVFGLKRQSKTLQNMMRQAAVSIGGDALIELHHTQQNIQANVIIFEKVIV